MSESSELNRLTDEIKGMRQDLTTLGKKQAVSDANHLWVNKNLDTHGTRLNKHSERIDNLESKSSSVESSTRFNEWGVRLLVGAGMSIALLLLAELFKSGAGS